MNNYQKTLEGSLIIKTIELLSSSMEINLRLQA